MKDAAAQLSWIEVEASLSDDVDQIHRQQAAELWRREVIGGPVMQLLAAGGVVEPAGRIQAAAADCAEGEIGVGGAPLAQVHLDRLQVPAVAEAPGDEIHRVALQRPLLSQRLAHRLAMAHQGLPVGSGRRESAALVGLATGATEHLLMA